MTSDVRADLWDSLDVVDAQADAWCGLERALRIAVDGVWSFRAFGAAGRIVRAARLVGPTPWERVPWCLVRGGVYAAVLEAAGFVPELPGEVQSAEMDEMTAQLRVSGGEAAVAEYAATVAHIRCLVTFDPPAGGSRS